MNLRYVPRKRLSFAFSRGRPVPRGLHQLASIFSTLILILCVSPWAALLWTKSSLMWTWTMNCLSSPSMLTTIPRRLTGNALRLRPLKREMRSDASKSETFCSPVTAQGADTHHLVVSFVCPTLLRLTADSDDEGRGGDEPESEEDESNPYPLDGKFKDEYDRQQ